MIPQDSLPLCPEVYTVIAQPSPTHEFYQLTQIRQQDARDQQAFADHCAWYRQAARSVQQDLIRMRHDINILGWLCRRPHRSRSKHRSQGLSYPKPVLPMDTVLD